ncbi:MULTISPECIES: YbbR-like domain-containing protein [unclassified Butyrivibrio]|uniref:CdaR family protein n=1 Tax=unclassified Butyrivibrio TaxID=2639466 RepID=UPI0003B46262|nr:MULTISPECIES: CdaR family protein [unclassified Butyrivibrio]SDB37751.1 YbbR domain-containing protein [Butyrivibrio sp. INlla16]
MKKLNLTANLGLKIASLLFAALLWFLVTNISDPVDSVRFSNVPVTFRNANSITDNNQVYQVLEDSDVISTVTVYAPRSIVDSLSRDNVVAIADLENTTNIDGTYYVAIQLNTNKYVNQIQSITGTIDSVKLNIEGRDSKTLPISASTTGTLTDGYIIGDVVTDQNQIRITGAESIVQSVKTASVNVEVTGYTTNIGTNAEIHLYDADGGEVSKDNLKLSSTSVGVSVTILATKRVPVTYQVSGVPAEGYVATGEIDTDTDSVLLAGRMSVLNKIDTITVSDDSLDLTGRTEDLTTTIDLSAYLPGNVSFGDEDFNGIATVVAYIDKKSDKALSIPYSQIELMNIPEGYDAQIVDDNKTFTLSVSGLSANVNAISEKDVSGIIDVSQISEGGEDAAGTYRTAVSLSLPGGVTTTDTVEVTVKLTKLEEN